MLRLVTNDSPVRKRKSDPNLHLGRSANEPRREYSTASDMIRIFGSAFLIPLMGLSK